MMRLCRMNKTCAFRELLGRSSFGEKLNDVSSFMTMWCQYRGFAYGIFCTYMYFCAYLQDAVKQLRSASLAYVQHDSEKKALSVECQTSLREDITRTDRLHCGPLLFSVTNA
jgi:hypothetical protein